VADVFAPAAQFTSALEARHEEDFRPWLAAVKAARSESFRDIARLCELPDTHLSQVVNRGHLLYRDQAERLQERWLQLPGDEADFFLLLVELDTRLRQDAASPRLQALRRRVARARAAARPGPTCPRLWTLAPAAGAARDDLEEQRACLEVAVEITGRMADGDRSDLSRCDLGGVTQALALADLPAALARLEELQGEVVRAAAALPPDRGARPMWFALSMFPLSHALQVPARAPLAAAPPPTWGAPHEAPGPPDVLDYAARGLPFVDFLGRWLAFWLDGGGPPGPRRSASGLLKAAGIGDRSLLTKVLNEGRHLSPERAGLLAGAMELEAHEARAFELMVGRDQAKDAADRALYVQELRRLVEREEARLMPPHRHEALRNWLYLALHELAGPLERALGPGWASQPERIAPSIWPPTAPADVARTLADLTDAGVPTGLTVARTPAGSSFALDLAVYHNAMSTLARDALRHAEDGALPAGTRAAFLGARLALTEAALEVLVDRVRELRRELDGYLQALASARPPDHVIQVNLQLLPRPI
jgi:uncharacterized protein (TIGR02147 family)